MPYLAPNWLRAENIEFSYNKVIVLVGIIVGILSAIGPVFQIQAYAGLHGP
jgi:hypothetical protein